MSEMIETKQLEEKVILVGVSTSETDCVEESLDELAELAKTAGAVPVGRLIQNREAIHPGTYLGKGKIEELADLIESAGADGIICDDELSPAQMANLTDILDTKVMDRTLVILDIFAARASTREGKLQVELAQLKYRATRLIGFGSSMSRLGGGIGTRGPGEKKLEIDRRLIKSRIAQLNKELEAVKRHREVTREQRGRTGIPVAAIVGYTNAGKSTLLNRLTEAGVLEEDKLFATLDPTTRSITLESGQQLLLTDTVGFIRKLPHHLINAFRSTLEEAKFADIIIHMVDLSNPQMTSQMHTVYETLEKLEVTGKPMITAFNKIDKLSEETGGEIRDFNADKEVFISAGKEIGLKSLLDAIEDILRAQKIYFEQVLEYKDAGLISLIRKYGQLLKEEYTDEGILVAAWIPQDIYGRLTKR